MEVINDTIDIKRRLAANSAIRRNKNTEYLKTDGPINNRNTKTTSFDVAREDKIIIIICEIK